MSKKEDSGAGVVKDKKLRQLLSEESDEDVVNLDELVKERRRLSPWDEEVLVYGRERVVIKERKK